MITLSYQNKKALVSPEGGELIALYEGEHNLLWCRDPEIWGKSAPLLFPICGRLREGKYLYEGKTFEMAAHGFAGKKEYKVLSQSESAVTLAITEDEETLACYPFAFEFAVTYTLSDKGLEVIFTVTNRDDKTLPYSLGGHWGFALEESIEGYALRFDTPTEIERDVLDGAYISGEKERLETRGELLPLSYHICDNDTWVLRDAPRACTLLQGEKEIVRLEYPDSPHLLIWTKPEARFVCIEPWNGMPDGKTSGDITQKDSIHLLKAGATQSFVHKIIF